MLEICQATRFGDEEQVSKMIRYNAIRLFRHATVEGPQALLQREPKIGRKSERA